MSNSIYGLASFSDLYPTYVGVETSNKVITDEADTDMISGSDSETVEMTASEKKPRIIATFLIIIGVVVLLGAVGK